MSPNNTPQPTRADLSAGPQQHVAAFDFDGTLTLGDSLGPYLCHALGWPRWLAVLLRCSPWLLAYVLRLMSNHRAKARLLHASLSGESCERVQSWTEHFVQQQLPALWSPALLRRWVWHQQQGHVCLIVSASPGVYMHAVGQALGAQAVLCTELQTQDGYYTGALATPNCHGKEKVRRLQAWLETRGLNRDQLTLTAYGDSAGDQPLLALADHAWWRGRERAGRDRTG